MLGRVFEYHLTMFASAEGKTGGQFVGELHAQFAESAKLAQTIKVNLGGLGFPLKGTS